MNRRELNRLVAQLLAEAGSSTALLESVATEMRFRRGQIAERSSINLSLLGNLLDDDDALAHVYQSLNAPKLEAAYRATARQRRKFTDAEIPIVTQLFTPRWVVEFLLQNTLGRRWVQMHPDTRLRKTWRWLADDISDPQLPEDHALRAIDLRICDPACGTMNFGLVAVDLLRQIYREELDRAGETDWPQPSCKLPTKIDAAIANHNLFGFDIDPLALDLARQTLQIKLSCNLPENHLQLADTLFDKKIDAMRFDVIATNPPYLCARNLDPKTVAKLKSRYPLAWRDTCVCFIPRCLELLKPGGRLGILLMQSFLFTAAYEKLRAALLASSAIETAAHFGSNLFDVGNPGTLQTIALCFRAGASSQLATFYRLVEEADKQTSLQRAIQDAHSPLRFCATSEDLARKPRGAWMYWITPAEQKTFETLPSLGSIAPPRQGLATTDNRRFVRWWWEVEPPNFVGSRPRWKPYAKGGRFRRWHESPQHRVNWEDDGAEIKAAIISRYPYLNGQWQWVAKNAQFYGRSGITYSYLTSAQFSARLLDAGAIFDVAGSALFPDDPLTLLAIMNSRTASRLLAAINPTVNFQVGDLRQLPIPCAADKELNLLAARAVIAAKKLESFDETSPVFSVPAAWNENEIETLHAELATLQSQIDARVAELYQLPNSATPSPEIPARNTVDHARRWASYALGVWLGRFGSARGEIAMLCPLDPKLADDLRDILSERVGAKSLSEIEIHLGGFPRFFARDFFPWHNRLYKNSPVYAGLSHGEKLAAAPLLGATSDLMHKLLRTVGCRELIVWQNPPDAPASERLGPLAEWLPDARLRRALATAAIA